MSNEERQIKLSEVREKLANTLDELSNILASNSSRKLTGAIKKRVFDLTKLVNVYISMEEILDN